MFTVNGKILSADLRRISSLIKGEEVISFSSNKKKTALTLSVKTENYSLAKTIPCVSVGKSIEFGMIKDVTLKTLSQASDVELSLDGAELKFKYLKSTYQGRLSTVDYDAPTEMEKSSTVEIPPSLYSILFRQLPKLALKPTYATADDLIILVRGTKDGFKAIITDNFHTALMNYPTKDSFDFTIDIPASYGSLVAALIGENESFSCTTTDSSLSVTSKSVSLVLPHTAAYVSEPDAIIQSFEQYRPKISLRLVAEDLKKICKNLQAIYEEETFEFQIVVESTLVRFKAKSQLGSLNETIKIPKGPKKRTSLKVDRSFFDIVNRLSGECELLIDSMSNQIILTSNSEKYFLSYACLLLAEDAKNDGA